MSVTVTISKQTGKSVVLSIIAGIAAFAFVGGCVWFGGWFMGSVYGTVLTALCVIFAMLASRSSIKHTFHLDAKELSAKYKIDTKVTFSYAVGALALVALFICSAFIEDRYERIVTCAPLFIIGVFARLNGSRLQDKLAKISAQKSALSG